MVNILRSKRDATRFQVLIEVASYGPTIHQRSVSRRLDITPQAVSEYLDQLTTDGLVSCTGRTQYQVTQSGVNWLLNSAREMRAYFDKVDSVINNIALSAAIADEDIIKGQRVGLVMRDGVLLAVADNLEKCTGTAETDTSKGQDIGVSDIEGLIEFKHGKVTILIIPVISKGGSKEADLEFLKKRLSKQKYVGVIGLEALAALNQIGVAKNRFNFYGVSAFASEACLHGVSPTIVCSENESYQLISDLREKYTEYDTVYLTKT